MIGLGEPPTPMQVANESIHVRPATADDLPALCALGREIGDRICAECWAEWQGMEVMVINELRLNFMDPGAQAVLDQHMRQFLAMEAEEEPGDEGGAG